MCGVLLKNEYNVYGVDSKQPQFDSLNDVNVIQEDLLSKPKLPNVDVIVHLAAHSQVQQVVQEPGKVIENVEMTQHVLEEAQRLGAGVVNISSRDVYGSDICPSEEEVTTESPNEYAASKFAGEALVNAYTQRCDLNAISLRLSNVYGPKDANKRVIPVFIAAAESGEELTVFGQGKLLDFIYISDVCRSIRSSIENLSAISGESINIGSGIGTPLTEVASKIANMVHTCPGYRTTTNRTGDVDRYVADISKAESLLDFEPQVRVEEGLNKTVRWYQREVDDFEDMFHSM